MATDNDIDNVRTYGGDDSGAWVAPKGSTPPADLTDPTTPYVCLGWLGEDGVDYTQAVEKTEFFAHQGGARIKVKYGKATRSFKVVALEETLQTLELVHPGLVLTKTGTGATTQAKGTIPAGLVPDEMAWVIDETDDTGTGTTILKRWEFTGTVDPSMTVAHKSAEFTGYEFTIDAVGPVELITNSPGVIAALT